MRLIAGVVLLLLWLLLAITKAQQGVLVEMLWGCMLSSLVLAVGLIANWPRLGAIGLLYHLAIGLPSYGVFLVSGGVTTRLSLLLHLLSPLLGCWVWRRPLPLATAGYTWLAILGLTGFCYGFTPEVLNINLAFQPWPPLAPLGLWLSRILHLLLLGLVLLLVQWQFNGYWQRRQAGVC